MKQSNSSTVREEESGKFANLVEVPTFGEIPKDNGGIGEDYEMMTGASEQIAKSTTKFADLASERLICGG